MPICPIHGIFKLNMNTSLDECPNCKEENIIVFSSEFDKQDRIIDTMVSQGAIFEPNRSRVILTFRRGIM